MSLSRSRDIFATARTLVANGVDLLPIPDNYYDDIEAKTDLPPATIDELKALNILYERDGETEYLQALHATASRTASSSKSSNAAADTRASAPRTRRSG